jgi:hypothetical protein
VEYWEYWTPEEHERLIENMSAWMDGELPDIADTPEAGGPDDLELEVAEHQACCPSCRALFEELKELRAGFEALPEPDPPEGFAQGVMDRIREEARPKVIPLFKRPQVRALAGLAACLVLAVGLYGAGQQKQQADFNLLTRGFSRDALLEDGERPMVNAALPAPEDGEAPQIAAYAAPEDGEVRKAAPNPAAEPPFDVIITFERLPEGWEELLPGIASPGAVQVSVEEAREFLHLLEEQGITCEISGSLGENSRCQLLLAED